MTKRGHGVNAMKSETQDSHLQEPGTLRNGDRWRIESDSIGEVRVPADRLLANDVAIGFGGASGYLEMNVYKPLMIHNLIHSITIMTDGCTNFREFLIEGTKPNLRKINEDVDRSLMLVTALSPVIGYDKASKIAHYAMDNDLTLKAAALKLGYVTEELFDRVVDPVKMVNPYVAGR